MRTKNDERKLIFGNMVAGIILAAVILGGYVLFTANPKELLYQMQEKRETAAWNKEVADLIDNGDAEEAMNMADHSAYELTEENAAVIQMWKIAAKQEEQLIADMLGEIRDAYLNGEKEQAENQLISLCSTYPDSTYVKAYMELLNSVEKTLAEKDMYDWKYGGKPGYGTYKDYRGNAITGFCFRSNYLSNGEHGYFDTKSYTKLSIEADCIAMGSDTLPITITDMNTGKASTIHCPKGSIAETIEITGGDIQISTPDDSIYAYGSAVLRLTVTKELTEADFAAVDARF